MIEKPIKTISPGTFTDRYFDSHVTEIETGKTDSALVVQVATQLAVAMIGKDHKWDDVPPRSVAMAKQIILHAYK